MSKFVGQIKGKKVLVKLIVLMINGWIVVLS